MKQDFLKTDSEGLARYVGKYITRRGAIGGKGSVNRRVRRVALRLIAQSFRGHTSVEELAFELCTSRQYAGKLLTDLERRGFCYRAKNFRGEVQIWPTDECSRRFGKGGAQ